MQQTWYLALRIITTKQLKYEEWHKYEDPAEPSLTSSILELSTHTNTPRGHTYSWLNSFNLQEYTH